MKSKTKFISRQQNKISQIGCAQFGGIHIFVMKKSRKSVFLAHTQTRTQIMNILV